MKSLFFKSEHKVTLLLVIFLLICNQSIFPNNKPSQKEELTKEFESSLQEYILKQWYPRSIDSVEGGYFTEFNNDWEKPKNQPKMIVSQSRLIWTSSQAALFYQDTSYIKYARHGVNFLKNGMWDEKYGGYMSYYKNRGTGFGNDKSKQAYGNAFAIYGLSAYYMVTKNDDALEMAKKCFYWLENHHHDSIYGGYLDRVNEDGSWPENRGNNGNPGFDPSKLKDYNSSIHLLEAFTSLYKVWPDPLVKVRLTEMLNLVRDTIVGEKGYEGLYFTQQWKHISNRDLDEESIRQRSYMDHISFGHDVETAFLILEASHALELKDDTFSLRIAKKLVNHSLKYGFNNEIGGFYDAGYYFKDREQIEILNKDAQWWVQAEGLNALLLMSEIFPEEKKYYLAFLKQWDFVNQYVIDKENGEWYSSGLNTNPKSKDGKKGSIWKVNYHNGRALMNCIDMLMGENEVASHFKHVAEIK